jgi:hypothetical protein
MGEKWVENRKFDTLRKPLNYIKKPKNHQKGCKVERWVENGSKIADFGLFVTRRATDLLITYKEYTFF